MTTNNEEEMPRVFVGCTGCKKVFEVDIREVSDEGNTWECPHCSAHTPTIWFAPCDECGGFTGFDHGSLGEALFGIGKSALGGFLNPFKTLNVIERMADSIPAGKAWGQCTICRIEVAVCPRCDYMEPWDKSLDYSTIIKCSNCNSQFRHP